MTVDPLELLAERLDPTPDPYLRDPAGWVNGRLGEHLTIDQKNIFSAVLEERYVAVPSCHDVGKSWLASRAAAWWIDVHEPGEAFVVTTAPTAAQVGAILWREIARAHRKGGLPGRITGQNEWKLELGGPAELVAYGRKPADYDPAAFQGIHARYVLVLIDEACGVPRSIYDAADSLATNENARVLAVGNPDDPASHFREICKPGSGWHVVQIDALKSPNFTREAVARHPRLQAYMIRQGIPPSQEEVPADLRDLLVSPTWVAERIARWGVDSPLFQSKVRGQFPKISIDTLINPHWVTLAQARELKPQPTDAHMGVDVARYGTDHSVIMLRQGGHCRVAVEIARGPVTELAGKVIEKGLGFISRPIANIDDVGVGGGVTDILAEEGYPHFPMIANAASEELMKNGKPRFADARSEWWWRLREALAGPSGTGEDGWLDLDPEDDELAAQITNVKYKINRHGQIQVESKDDMKKRGLASPDRGDALTYALHEADVDRGRARTESMLTAGLMHEQM